MTQSLEQQTVSAIERAKQILRTPFACSESEKLLMIESLAELSDNKEAIACITEALNLIEIPVNGSTSSKADTPHGGVVSVSAARILAKKASPETDRILLEASGTVSHHPLLRASILYGVQEAESPLLEQCLQLGLVDPDWTVKKAALTIVDDYLKGELGDEQKEVAHTLLQSFLFHQAAVHSHNELIIQGSLTIFERIKNRVPLGKWLKDIIAGEELAPLTGYRLALLLEFVDNQTVDEIVYALLSRKDQLPEMYDYIAGQLYRRRFPEGKVEALCREIALEKGWLSMAKSALQRIPAEVIEARKRAAQKLISDS